MQDFTWLRHITIGQYLPGDSLAHRLDPRAKITIALLLTVAMMVNASYLGNLLLLAICLGLVGASGVSLRYILSGMRPAAPILAMLIVFQILFMGNSSPDMLLPARMFFQWGPIAIGAAGFQLAFVLMARFFLLTVLASLLTNTTPMSYLAYGIEDMLRPFRRLGLPAHEISVVGASALRGVPRLGEELETIMKAQASRGADLGTRRRFNFIHTTRAVLVVLVPLFLDAFRRAEELIVAMEARCYVGGQGRTRMVQLRLAGADWLAMAGCALASACLVIFRTRFPF